MKSATRWDERYRTDDTPWESGQPHTAIIPLFAKYVPRGTAVLEIGCGLGTDARWLADSGYIVTATDLSAEAIARAKARHPGIRFLRLDFPAECKQLETFPVVYDCAVLQQMPDRIAREAYVQGIANACAAEGLWINISCDQHANTLIAAATGVEAPPSITLTELVTVVEPHFELVTMDRCAFPVNRRGHGKADFVAWAAVFRKR